MIARRGVGVRSAQGFTLIEAIVAMVIMATSLIALYAWLGSSVIALNRVKANALALDDARAALAVIETINPMAEPQGEREVESLQVRWTSSPLTEQRFGVSQAGFATAFDLILYELTVEVSRDGQTKQSFQVRRAGWNLARPFNLDEL